VENKTVVFRGGGDVATGSIYRLHKAGFKVVVLEIEKPTVIRRTVSFAQAVFDGEITIEGVKGQLAKNVENAKEILENSNIPVIIDPKGESIKELKPIAVVDGILAKKNLGTKIDMAPVVVGLGPGFEAGVDVNAVIETSRGHDLGRVILEGKTKPDSGVPGNIAGYSWERVIRSSCEGEVKHASKLGDIVKKGQVVMYVGDTEVLSPLDGCLRGLINEGTNVTEGFKIGDVDPRGIVDYCYTISDKARAIGGSVLEAIMYFINK
jgi:xanthine dehydrogenase accessory factor